LLEPYEGKPSRTVLRGESGSNAADLLDGLAHERLGYGYACFVSVSGEQRLVYIPRRHVYMGHILVYISRVLVYMGNILVYISRRHVYMGNILVYISRKHVYMGQRLEYMSRVLKYAASFSPVESFYLKLPESFFGEEMQRLAIFFEDSKPLFFYKIIVNYVYA
jgi:hypothetical protein